MELNNFQHTLLFVDDEENILRSLRRLFMEDDYEILTATSGPEGLKLLETREVSLIISDQRMPEMTGAEFLSRAKIIAPETIRIVLTGYADIHAAMDAINNGEIYRYINKPWNDEELRIIVKEALDRYGLIKENKRLAALTEQQNQELKTWNAKLEERVREQTIDIQKRNQALVALNEQLKKNFASCLEAFSSLIELRGNGADNHSKNVAELSERIARAMSFAENEIEIIHAAATLHDIGKIGIPNAILEKNERQLTKEERKLLEQHPIRGQASVAAIEDLREAGILIRHHHEWMNGNGYPDNLKGDKIPIGSRIISLADAVDRFANPGEKGGRFNFTKALEVIKGSLGIRFDPEIFSIAEPIVTGLGKIISRCIGTKEDIYWPADLKPGMVLSRDVRSGTGLLILSAGTVLTRDNILALERYYNVDPSKEGIYVWKGNAASSHAG